MTAKELYNLQETENTDVVGTFDEFISEFEDKWLQYSDEETKVKAYFGNADEGFKLFEKWKNGFKLFSHEENIAFREPYIFPDK